jgi:translation initiation factor IF-3
MSTARVNGRIKATRVRVIDREGADLGIFALREALEMAQGRSEDLIEIGPDDEPPLCQVMDYGEYRWRIQEQQKDRAYD